LANLFAGTEFKKVVGNLSLIIGSKSHSELHEVMDEIAPSNGIISTIMKYTNF